MEFINLIFSVENVRTLALFVGISAFIVWRDMRLEKRIDRLEVDMIRGFSEVDRRFDGVDRKLDSVKELTYVLNKNKIITDNDKKHIDSYLTAT